MKKTLAVIVAFMYLAITSGLVLQVHYCMGRQTGSSLQLAELTSFTCSYCGMQNAKNKCCHDDIKFIKLQDAHQQVTADYTLDPPLVFLPQFNCIDTPLRDINSSVSVCNHSPPGDEDDGQPTLFIFHRLLRI